MENVLLYIFSAISVEDTQGMRYDVIYSRSFVLTVHC